MPLATMRPLYASCLLLTAVAACTDTSTSSGDNASSSGSGSNGGLDAGRVDAGRSGSSSGRPDAGGGVTTNTITGRMLAPSGTFGIFEGRVWVEWEENGETIRRQSSTRYDGKYTLNRVPVGDLVVHAERGHYAGTTNVTMPSTTAQLMDIDVMVSPGAARFVVVEGIFDDIGAIVDDLGLPTVWVSGGGFTGSQWLDTVANATYLQDKTAVMLNCGMSNDIFDRTDLATRRQALRDFVAAGHSLYISDWAYDVMEWLHPEVLDFFGDDLMPDSAQSGDAENVLGTIGDATLEKLVGRTVTITYDLPDWAVITGLQTDADGGTLSANPVEVLVRGTVHVNGQEYYDVPLAVRLRVGEGSIIYTTFHNESQLDDTMLSILRYMVLRL
jgi:hypothetical protein